MKINNYLEILDKLPEKPFNDARVEVSVMLDRLKDNNLFNTIVFNYVEYIENNIIKYKWECATNIDIDYKLNGIYLSINNRYLVYKLYELFQTFKFKNLSYDSPNDKYFYINFKERFWCYNESKSIDYTFISDSEILENIFIRSINEYCNGIPIVWED
jgi:hypothetical protein